MNKKLTCAVIIVLAVSGFFAYGQEQKELSLTLEDAIVKALKSNLNVAVQVYTPEYARASITRAKEFFMPRIDISGNDNRSESPATFSILNTGTTVGYTWNSSAAVTQQIPFGGNIEASLSYYRNKTNQLFQNYNPYYQSTLNFTLTQPLLRNFGWSISRTQIIVAETGFESSRGQFKATLANTIFSVEQAYWNLVFSIEYLKVKQQSLQLGRDLLSKTKKEVEVGQTAPIEVLRAEATVASRDADLIQAEAQVKSRREDLKALLNLGTGKADAANAQLLIPADQPTFKPFQITFDDALQLALAKRPELEAQKATIEGDTVNFSYAKNQLLPQLNFVLTKMSPGISGDRLIYQNNDPFTGIIVGTIPGSVSQSMHDAFRFLYNNWTVGVTLSIPIGDIFSHAAYAQAKINLQQQQAQLKYQEQQIYVEVSNAVLDLETAAKSVDAYRIARELAEKTLEAETKKLNVGLTTNYFVLTYQDSLASARSAELQALVSYNIAVANIAKVTGTSLEKRNISVADYLGSK